MLKRVPFALAVLALAASAHAATINVVIEGDNPPITVVDAFPPVGGPRIQCPPSCVYSNDGPNTDLLDLRVEQELDPRTNNRPYDIVSLDGCVGGGSALPNTTATCRVPQEGNATITVATRYRPVLAVTYGGTMGAPVGFFTVTGSPGPDYMGAGSGFACPATLPENPTDADIQFRSVSCARHLSVDQPVFVLAPDNPPLAEFVSASAPCSPVAVNGGAGQRCDFTLTGDTCISVLYLHSRPPTFPEVEVTGPACPTGPGVEGGGGGGGGGGDVPPEVQSLKDQALVAMRAEFEQVLYPCLVNATGISIFASLLPLGSAYSLMIGGSLIAASTPACVGGIRRLMQLQLIYNDPPDPNFQEVAKVPKRTKVQLDLPSCDEFSGSEKKFCKKLGKGLTKWADKDQRESDIAETLRITVERAVGAFQSDDEKALKKQLKAMKKRERQLERASKQTAKRGEKLAKLLEKEQITIALDAEQFTDGVDETLAELAAEGWPEEDAREVLGETLDPRALDWISAISAP